ncbi:MAG: hypothetical protein U0941_01020 [Planctomycetaceae bacterium]
MKSQLRQIQRKIAVVCLGISLITPGCAIGSKTMSIDSTSKMPWFGLELKGRKPKSDGPSYRSVRNENGDKSRIDTLGRKSSDASDSSGKSSMVLPLTDRNLLSDNGKKDDHEIDFQ